MAYWTYSDIDEEIGSALLADLLTEVGSADREDFVNDTLISNAEALVNGHVVHQRTVPVPSTSTTVYGMVRKWSLAVILFELFFRGAGQDVPIKYRLAYEDALSQLASVSNGRLSITDTDGTGPGTDGTAFYAESDDPVMDIDNLGEVY